jgi:hypothetical protein
MACLCLQAQAETLKANVPFEFRVGSVVMPAGEYVLEQSGRTLFVRGTEGPGRSIITLAHPAYRPAAQGPGKLVFNRYGNDYFLSKVWSPSTQMGHVLPLSKLEKEIIARYGHVQTAGVRLRKK